MLELGEISYDQSQQIILNLVLGLMVFGVALDIRPKDFVLIVKKPKAPAAGLVAQFLLLPAVTCLITLLVDLPAGVELGMILVAACPGGAISNFITSLSRGNAALSICMTAVSSIAAIFLLPFNFTFWAGFNPEANALMQAIDVSGWDIFQSLLIVLAIPLVLGQLVVFLNADIARKIYQKLKIASVLLLFIFIAAAVAKNSDAFSKYFVLLFTVVLAHNATALLLGFLAAKLTGLSGRDTRAVTIEVGIQNSSLAIAIVFTQFGAQAGMALIAAFWGTWHIVSGLLICTVLHILDKRAGRIGDPAGVQS
jgi:BASS family bile acid:Na+ symporter